MQYSEAIGIEIGQIIKTQEAIGEVKQIISTKSCAYQDIPTLIGVKVGGVEELIYILVDLPESICGVKE